MPLTFLPAAAAAPGTCGDRWEIAKVVSGLGQLENLEPDGRGGFYLSGVERGVIYHVDGERHVTTVATGLDAPAGLRLVGSSLYFLTGDGAEANLLQLPTGTLSRLDPATGHIEQLVRGLTAPNGLLALSGGDLLLTRVVILGPSTGITRYSPATGRLTPNWAPVPSANGLSFTPDRRAVYTDNASTGEIYRIPLDAPRAWTTTAARLDPVIAAPDDFQATIDGNIYLAANFAGTVYRLDPVTGTKCTIASGLLTPNYPPGPTSVRIAPDGDRLALYVTASDGALYRLRPPRTTNLTPA